MDYFVTNLYHASELEEFKRNISEKKEFTLSFHLSSIGFSNSYIDIVRDYAITSFCCEKIAPLIDVIDSGIVTRDKYYKDFKIKCKALNVENLANDLSYFSEILTEELKEYDDIDVISFYDEVSEYEKSFSKRVFVFPELINNYWANLINGAYWEIASEYYESESKFFTKTYRKYPEHRFFFWKNALSSSFKNTIYFSTENWIIPPNTNISEALKVYSEVNNISLAEADKIDYNGRIILISNSNAVYFTQYRELLNSLQCIKFALEKDKKKQPKNHIMQVNLFGESILYKSTKRSRLNYKDRVDIDDHKIKYKISEFGDIITLEYEGYTCVFFSTKILTFEEIKDINSYLYPAYSKTQHLIETSITEKCQWNELDDNSFEELCYDILCCHPSFDSSTIQKMGKSKSRDGGRDIVIKTKKTPTKEPELYIFQCKFFSDKTSLSASKLSNAGNVILQYGCGGYGVFTTTVIDSTLHDMLDGFSNRNIDTSFRWSKYDLERYLNRCQAIKNKYFKQ